jgi:hypothetical protein
MTKTKAIGRVRWWKRQGVWVSKKPAEDQRDEAKVGELTCLLQTIYGLVDPEDDESFFGSGRLDKGEEGKTGENCGRASADVNSNELTLGEGKGDRGA